MSRLRKVSNRTGDRGSALTEPVNELPVVLQERAVVAATSDTLRAAATWSATYASHSVNQRSYAQIDVNSIAPVLHLLGSFQQDVWVVRAKLGMSGDD